MRQFGLILVVDCARDSTKKRKSDSAKVRSSETAKERDSETTRSACALKEAAVCDWTTYRDEAVNSESAKVRAGFRAIHHRIPFAAYLATTNNRIDMNNKHNVTQLILLTTNSTRSASTLSQNGFRDIPGTAVNTTCWLLETN